MKAYSLDIRPKIVKAHLAEKQRGKPQLSHLTNAEPFVKALVAEHPDANAGRVV
jgi:hypothetical protein